MVSPLLFAIMTNMRKHYLSSIVLVIVTVLITNFSFALMTKDAFAPALDHTIMTMENTTHNNAHMQHHSSDPLTACEIHCDALMMSCTLGISNLAENNLNGAYDTIIKKLNPHASDKLYAVDLFQDHKPPIFS